MLILSTTICLIFGTVTAPYPLPDIDISFTYPDSPGALEGSPCSTGYSIPKQTMSQYFNCMKHNIVITPNLGASQCSCINKLETDEKKCAVLTAIQRDWLCGDLKPYCHGEDKIPPEFNLDDCDLNMDSFQVGVDNNNSDLVALEAQSIYVAMTAVNRLYALAHNEYCGSETVTPLIPGWNSIHKIYIKGENSERFLFAELIQKNNTYMIVLRGEQTYMDAYVANSRDLEWNGEVESFVNPEKFKVAWEIFISTWNFFFFFFFFFFI
eukprot:GHVR01078476.1.p1 GENE.GHVR01078476.1~~GHVR01078476.1.p1  ORF type:complete len:267 (+),score=32.94 GHVR01078476.1:42-842(+)